MAMNKALSYAEETLGVHRTWLDSQEIVTQLQADYRTHAGFEAECRDLTGKIERRKQDILCFEADAEQPDSKMSVTAFERHIKLVQARDEQLGELYELYGRAMANKDAIQAQIRGAEMNLKAHVARMNELGGYFSYLAVAKQAHVAFTAVVNDYPW